MIPLITRDRARAFDAEWIARGVPSLLLMENAGRGAAELAVQRFFAGDARGKRVVVVCGRGNNGGDGLVLARRLHVLGAQTRVSMLEEPAKGGVATGDAGLELEAYRALGLPVAAWSTGALDPADLIVDALFGTGLSRALEGAAAAIVQAINAASAPVLALDVPSGLDADTGIVHGAHCVRATVTATFGLAKIGLYTPRGSELAGEVIGVDIGVPSQLLVDEQPGAWLITEADARAKLAARRVAAHKNANGHVLVIGGSPGKTGAPQLAAYGALRAGAGLVTVASWQPDALTALPMSVMRRALDASWDAELARMHAVVAGPGLGTGREAAAVFERLIAHEGALVLDADAFTWAAKQPGLFVRSAPTVLTPHPAELGRVLGIETKAIEADRLVAARAAASATGAVVVLKGAHTVVAAPDQIPVVSPFAVPVLGVAGSGDTLAGVIGALLGAGHAAFEAAWLGVWLHGEAARVVASAHGGTDRGITPTEVADALPRLFARPSMILNT